MEFDRDAIQVFIGGGNAEWLPTVVLEYSIRRNSERLIQVTPLASVERDIPIPVPKNPNNRQVTSFSFQRFLIPQALGDTGRGIYLDSDMIVVGDIGELWDTPFPPDIDVLMCPGWQSAVMLIDARAGWRIAGFVDLMDRQALGYKDLVNVKKVARCANVLDPQWNCMDRPDPKALDLGGKLLHYTDMGLQPWLNATHPHGDRWIEELLSAIKDEFLREEDVMREIEAGHVRPSLALALGNEAPYEDEAFVPPYRRGR